VTRSPIVRRLPLLLLTATLAASCKEARPRERPRVPVTAATVVQRSVPNEISAIGSVTPIQAVAVRSQVGGTLVQVGFEEGEDVRAGQILFQIDPRPYEAALEQAQAVLARDLVQLANARQQVTRYEELSRTQMASREQYDQYRTNAEVLAAAVTSDSASVRNARLNLEYCTIRARITGRSGGLLVREGNLVRAADAQALVLINQLHPIAVSFAVPQQYLDDIRRFSRGRRLDVIIRPQDDTTRTMAGRLSFINNQVDTTTGTIVLKATFPNGDGRLWPGQFVTVRLILDVQLDVLTIPSQAVMTGQVGSFVFVVNADGSASTRPIAVGRAVGDDIVVDSGLVAGEQVVTDGQLRLIPGARVELKDTGAAALGAGSRRAGRGGRPGADSAGRQGARP
jgi:multidrug efflux system membrane fusion protein